MTGRVPFLALVLGLSLALSAHADEAELHTFHCLNGCPVGAPATSDIVVREIYTLSSNDQTKFADWVAYRVTPDTIGPSKDRVWASDPWLSPEETLEPDDYTGAFNALKTDRGHQAPLAAFSGTSHWAETNFLSNITPQKSALNQGPWQRLEAHENDLVLAERINLYVLTGPLYERVVKCARESRELATLRDSLLPKLISGNLRVENAEKFVLTAGP